VKEEAQDVVDEKDELEEAKLREKVMASAKRKEEEEVEVSDRKDVVKKESASDEGEE